MKIILITDLHERRGDIKKYVLTLKARLEQNPKIKVYAVGFGTPSLRNDNCIVLPAPRTKFGKLISKLFYDPGIFFKLRRLLKQINPDIIHLHHFDVHTFSLLKALRPYPVVHTTYDFGLVCPTSQNVHPDLKPCEHGLQKECYWHHQHQYAEPIYLALTYWWAKLRKHILQTANYFIAPSPLLAQYLKKMDCKNVIYVPPFKAKKTAISFKQQKRTHFLYAGCLKHGRSLRILLEEFNYALRLNPKLILNLVGEASEAKALLQHAEFLGIKNNVTLNPPAHLKTLLDECLSVIYPTIGLEAFGTMITEAMENARPVIAVNRGNASWLIHHKYTGLLYDPLKKGDLAQQILYLASNVRLAKKLGENAFNKLHQSFDNDEILEQIMEVYRKCIREHR